MTKQPIKPVEHPKEVYLDEKWDHLLDLGWVCRTQPCCLLHRGSRHHIHDCTVKSPLYAPASMSTGTAGTAGTGMGFQAHIGNSYLLGRMQLAGHMQ